MSKWERKFGKYAISNLTIVLILCYVAGYVLNFAAPWVLQYLTLDPYAILHGQVWRIFTWVISPPSSFDLFTIIMLLFYYSLGTALESAWGTWRYNVYIFTGMLLTVLGSFICMGLYYLLTGGISPETARVLFATGSLQFSTYYINMSIFLAYAATFPEAQILLMFVIPVKVKWMGIIYLVVMVLDMFQYAAASSLLWFSVAAIAASLVNILIFWLRNIKRFRLSPKQIRRRARFRQDVRRGEKASGHKCAVCGRTEEDDPSMEFRFCSKCNGNYEYCSYHLFTHEHKK